MKVKIVQGKYYYCQKCQIDKSDPVLTLWGGSYHNQLLYSICFNCVKNMFEKFAKKP